MCESGEVLKIGSQKRDKDSERQGISEGLKWYIGKENLHEKKTKLRGNFASKWGN